MSVQSKIAPEAAKTSNKKLELVTLKEKLMAIKYNLKWEIYQ